MSDSTIHSDDPRLTAYALGELSPTEQAEVERLLANTPAGRAAVEEIRGLAGQLTAELQLEPAAALSDAQRSSIIGGTVRSHATHEVAPSPGVRWTRHLVAIVTVAAMGAMAVLMLPPTRPGSLVVHQSGDSLHREELALREVNLQIQAVDDLDVDRKELRKAEVEHGGRSSPAAEQHAEKHLGDKLAADAYGTSAAANGQATPPLGYIAPSSDRPLKFGNAPTDGSVKIDAPAQRESGQRAGSRPLSPTSTAPKTAQHSGEPLLRKRIGASTSRTDDTRAITVRTKGSSADVVRDANESQAATPAARMPQQPAQRGGEIRSKWTADGWGRKPAGESEHRGLASDSAPALPGLSNTEKSGAVVTGKPGQLQQNSGLGASSESARVRRATIGSGGAEGAAARSPTRVPSEPDVKFVKEKENAQLSKLNLESAPTGVSKGAVVSDPTNVPESKNRIEELTRLSEINQVLAAKRENAESSARNGAEIERKSKRYVNLMTQGRYDDAAVVASEAKQLSPENPVVEALELEARLQKKGYAVAPTKKKLDELVEQLHDFEAAAVTRPIEYPELAKWRELAERRKALAARELDREGREAFFLKIRQPVPGAEQYEPISENPFVYPREQPLSTFGVDVDTASYANMRRFLNQGQWPPANAIRIEELVNYFSYDYPQPGSDRPFSVNVETGQCPWQPEHRLVRIGLKGKDIARDKRPASNLVFLVDVSGSMADHNKLPLVKTGLNLLAEQMTESDRVAIVTYSDTAAVRLDSTTGNNQQTIRSVINSLNAAGSTNGAAGIQMAYDQAVRHFINDGTNRVILCTDGDFNVGVTGDDELVKMIQERARTKVYFSVFGFGMGNLKDGKLEKLADKGNGHYAYVDDENEIRKLFVEELSGTLITIAKDVKIQVEFNPAIVGAYRQIGYENRALAAADFADDKKDAGEIGAGHSVTALYEIVPAERTVAAVPQKDKLRYQAILVPKDGAAAAELLTVRLRYKEPDAASGSEVAVIPLSQLDPEATAARLRQMYDAERPDAPTVEFDAKEKRLIVRGRAEAVEQVRVVLRALGEETDASLLYEMHVTDMPPNASRPSPDFNWAAAVAGFAMVLRGSDYRGQAGLDMILELAQGAKGEDKTGRRQEFINLVQRARALRPETATAVHRSERSTPIPPVADPAPLTREEAQQKATVNGKYRNLLRVIEAPSDAQSYGAFRDWGHFTGTTYREHKNLPPGYWVYVAPHWYIWGDAKSSPVTPRL